MGIPTVADATLEVLLDREHELGAITSAVTAAFGGDGSALLLRGPAGIGKTALLRAGATVAADRGLVVLGARGAELESDFGFGVVRQLFASVTASPDGDRAVLDGATALDPAVLDGATALAAAVLGVEPVADAGRGPDGPDAAFAKLEALTRVTARLAASSGLALIVDDAHWADAASLRFLAYLARRIQDLPVVLILAARDGTEIGAAAVDAMLADSDAMILKPGPLSSQAAERLVRTALPETGEAICRACHAVTGGNPLFLSELARTLRVCAGVDAIDVLAVVPASAVEAIRDRLRRLTTSAARLATAVAVLGDGSLLRHAAAVAGIAHEDAMLAADDLVRAGILRAERPLRFLHPLLRSAAYELLLPGERAAAHALAADLLSAEDAEPERVAAHLLACDPRGHLRVCHWLCAAAHEAMHRGAPDAASTYLMRALDEPPPSEQRAEIHLLLGEAQALTPHPGAAADHLRRGIAGIDDPRRKLQAATLLAGMLAMDGRGEDAVRALDEALAQRRQAGEDEPGVVEAHLLNVARHDILTRARCLELAQRVRDRARLTLPGTGVELTAAAAEEAMAGDDAGRTAALALEALARLEAEGAFPADYTAFTAARSLIMADSFDAAERCLGRSLASARAHGATVACASFLGLQCELHYRRGALKTAAMCGRESLQTAHDGWATGIPAVSSALGSALIELDDLDGAHRTIEAALDHSSGSAYPTTMLLLARGRLRLARDLPDAALSDVLEVGRRQEKEGEPNPTLMDWRSLAAEALATLGRTAQAAALAEEEVQLARRFGAPRALGNALRVAGIIAAGVNGTARLREAVHVLSRSSARLTWAYAQADLGTALRRSGGDSEARIMLRHALDAAHGCGGALLERRVLAELRLAGARPRRASLCGVDALTASERRIVDLAALDLSNHEIASRLVVSVRTVEFHLSGAFRKLGIGSRRQLTNALAVPVSGGPEHVPRRLT